MRCAGRKVLSVYIPFHDRHRADVEQHVRKIRLAHVGSNYSCKHRRSTFWEVIVQHCIAILLLTPSSASDICLYLFNVLCRWFQDDPHGVAAALMPPGPPRGRAGLARSPERKI